MFIKLILKVAIMTAEQNRTQLYLATSLSPHAGGIWEKKYKYNKNVDNMETVIRNLS